MDLELVGKRAIVTGGSRGIGLAIAKALAAEGANVALVARDAAALTAAKAAVEEAGKGAGGQVLTATCDTRDDASVRQMAADVEAAFGGVDILVNAAAQPGGGAAGGLEAFDEADFSEQVNTKVLGYLRCARAVVGSMKASGWGRIINISGTQARATGAITGTVRNVAVAAATKNLADELGRYGINANVVHPGSTVTERTPGQLASIAKRAGITEAEAEKMFASRTTIGRMVTSDEVASVVAFLASPKSVAINGDPVVVAGGVPGPIFY
jgi:NAD(P)-dependent dehydrogenase (short-subunit alcohol dehydrogenase family)